MDSEARTLLPNFVDLLLDAVFLVDAHGRIVYVNAASERIFGYAPHELAGRSLFDFVVPEDRARTLEEARQVMAGRPRVGFENRYIRKDGRQVHIMWSARWSEADRLRIGVARDVTERKHAEEIQAATYAISEAAHNATDLGTMFREIHRIVARLVPLAGLAVATSDPATRRLDFPYQMDMYSNSHVMQEPLAHRYCIEAISSKQPVQQDEGDSASSGSSSSWLAMPLITQNEAIGALLLKSFPGATYSGKETELLQFVSAQIATVIERKRLHAELLHAARYDELTRLPNRRLFHDRLTLALARCRREHGSIALLYVDIDDFKQINDSLGHAAGDLVLREVALRLTHCIREEDTAARLGGDEFAVLLEGIHTPEDAAHVVEKIRDALHQPVTVDGLVLRTRASIGMSLYPEHGVDAEALLKRADQAMYLEKKGGAA